MERSYEQGSDLELMAQAAENLSEAGSEEYWAALLESAPELAEDRGQLKGLMKDYRAQAKRLAESEAKLAEAKRQLTTTNRKLNTRGIAGLSQSILKELGAGDAKNRGVAKQLTQIITDAYQKGLDAIDRGEDAPKVWDIVYYEGIEKAADYLLENATHSEKYSYSWTTTSLGQYTLTYAAPAIINGERVNVGVVIQFASDGRPRAVNAETESGGLFRIEKTAQGPRSRTGKSQVLQLLTRAVSTEKIAQHGQKVKSKDGNSGRQNMERSYEQGSDLELMANAAEALSEAGSEEYWAALLESAPELKEDQGQLKGLMKDYRAQAKRLADTEARLAEAKRQLTTTNRKLNTRGIAGLSQDIMKALGAGDAKNRGVAKQLTQIITDAYQMGLSVWP